MPASLKKDSGTQLTEVCTAMVASIGETLAPLVGRQLAVRPGIMLLQEPDALAGGLPRPVAAARAALDGAFAEKAFLVLFELPDAIAMSGLLMMTPDDVITTRRGQPALEGDDREAFGELGNVLFTAFANQLKERGIDSGMKLLDHGVIAPGTDDGGMLGKQALVTFGFRLKLGEYPESTGVIVVERSVAEAWNGRPLELIQADGSPAAAAAAATAPPSESPNASLAAMRADDEAYERIPAAPIRGVLAAFIAEPQAFRTLRFSCRRVGLELRRHGRGEIPNPAAHRNEIVVLDVPPGEDRRFDWCRRIKELSETTRVVLLIHHPSRQRVTQAFLSRADVILGFPCDEMQLSQKLTQLLPEPPAQ